MYQRIRDLREDRDLTQKNMGEILNCSLNITVRQSRQSGVARATCPD